VRDIVADINKRTILIALPRTKLKQILITNKDASKSPLKKYEETQTQGREVKVQFV